MWPPRLPDLAPGDFYFWSKLKNVIYMQISVNIKELNKRIYEYNYTGLVT